MTVSDPSQHENVGLMIAALFLGAVLIAFAPIFVRVSEVGPVASGFYRAAIALPVLAWMASKQTRSEWPSKRLTRKDMLLLISAGFLLALDLGVWHISIAMTSVANATLFNNSAPIFVALASWIGGARLGRPFLFALFSSVAGMILLSSQGRPAIDNTSLIGDLLAIATGAFYGAYILVIWNVRQRASTTSCMLVSTFAAIPILLLFSFACGEKFIASSWRGWAILIGLALICHVGGQGLIARALAALPPASSAMVLLLQPVTAALIAWILFGEAQTPLQVFGIVLVLVGILVAQHSVWVRHDGQ